MLKELRNFFMGQDLVEKTERDLRAQGLLSDDRKADDQKEEKAGDGEEENQEEYPVNFPQERK